MKITLKMRLTGFMFFFALATLLNGSVIQAQQADREIELTETFHQVVSPENVVVRYQHGQFAGWPANNGIWSWHGSKEILVGYTYGEFLEQSGHKISNPRDGLARSVDGGKTWKNFYPKNYSNIALPVKTIKKKINFKSPGFVLRITGTGYHGSSGNETPRFYYSYDKGDTWNGPFLFTGTEKMEQLKDMNDLTPRTDYQVLGKHKCMMFFSATPGAFRDKTFAIRTDDGGLSFSFVSWIVPPSDPYRAVMPQTVNIGKNELVSVMRRRDKPGKQTQCWLDAYRSIDGGKSWSLLSRVAYTGFGDSNGNPPALTRLTDGRLCVVYGNRSLKMLLCRLSEDNGETWGNEIIIRKDLRFDGKGFPDFGYPRVTQRSDGKIVAIYYFSDAKHYEQHIACTIFSPDNLEDVEIKRKMIVPPGSNL